MKVDKTPFPVHTNTHTIDLSNAKVLHRPEQAEGAEGKNVVFGETRTKNVNDKILAKEVTLEKTPDGKESLKITVKASILNGQASSSQDSSRPPSQVQPVNPTGQTVPAQSRPNMFKAKRPEVGTWKVNESKVKEK